MWVQASLDCAQVRVSGRDAPVLQHNCDRHFNPSLHFSHSSHKLTEPLGHLTGLTIDIFHCAVIYGTHGNTCGALWECQADRPVRFLPVRISWPSPRQIWANYGYSSLCSNCHYNLLIQTDGCDSTRWLWLLYLWNTVTKTRTEVWCCNTTQILPTPPHLIGSGCEDGIRTCTAWRNWLLNDHFRF